MLYSRQKTWLTSAAPQSRLQAALGGTYAGWLSIAIARPCCRRGFRSLRGW